MNSPRDGERESETTGYTPGPWHVDPTSDENVDQLGTTLRAIESADGGIVGWVDMLPWGDETADNAALIASAPDMAAELASVKALAGELADVLLTVAGLPGFEPTEPYGVAVNAAIARARALGVAK
jgi:hypothetical protein